MELSYVSLYVILVSRSIAFIFYKRRKPIRNSAPLPPGKTGWPFLGESLEFLAMGRKDHPEKFIFDRMTKYSSHIFKTHLIGDPFAVFCGANGNRFLFSNENKLVQSWWPSSAGRIFAFSAQTSTGIEGLRTRNMLHNFVNPDALKKYVSIIDQISQIHFAEKWENNKEVLVCPLVRSYAFSLACKVFLSMEDPYRVARFYEHFGTITSGSFSIPINFPGTPFHKAIKASKLVRKQIVEIIKQRNIDFMTKKGDIDILSHMVSTSDHNGKFMDEFDISDKIMALLIGVNDTITSAITFIVNYLAELPEIYRRVYEEQMEIVKSKVPAGELLNWDDLKKMKYSWNVACEVLRLTPPLQGAFREAIVDFTYNGFSIPKGWKLYWNANSTHRNPEFFPEPQKFDPSRFEGSGPAPYTFVPFGGGPRICPGKDFARLEILVFMHHVVKRFKWEKIIPHEKIIVDPMAFPANGLPVRLYPHKP